MLDILGRVQLPEAGAEAYAEALLAERGGGKSSRVPTQTVAVAEFLARFQGLQRMK
jgi:hypothetical protein